jgi:hypothetical protein
VSGFAAANLRAERHGNSPYANLPTGLYNVLHLPLAPWEAWTCGVSKLELATLPGFAADRPSPGPVHFTKCDHRKHQALSFTTLCVRVRVRVRCRCASRRWRLLEVAGGSGGGWEISCEVASGPMLAWKHYVVVYAEDKAKPTADRTLHNAAPALTGLFGVECQMSSNVRRCPCPSTGQWRGMLRCVVM